MAGRWKSGNTQFPYGVFKALATVGEVDPARVGRKNPGRVRALTGVPDGSGAWLLDDDTVRIAYQSESQGSIWTRTPAGQTYPQIMKSGVTFTGSKLHFIDYDREGLSTFLEGESRRRRWSKTADFCSTSSITCSVRRWLRRHRQTMLSRRPGGTSQAEWSFC